MSDTTWINQEDILLEEQSNPLKFIIGGVLIVAALVFLVINTMQDTTQLFITVEEYYAQPAKYAGKDLRISGFVMGDSISFTQIDATNSRLEFNIVDDINNPSQTLRIVALNEPMPDLLQHEAQALVEGHIQNGEFVSHPDGLLLKCPTRYETLEPDVQS
jgi:cytochrome c-type biogenesis protein CcmE